MGILSGELSTSLWGPWTVTGWACSLHPWLGMPGDVRQAGFYGPPFITAAASSLWKHARGMGHWMHPNDGWQTCQTGISSVLNTQSAFTTTLILKCCGGKLPWADSINIWPTYSCSHPGEEYSAFKATEPLCSKEEMPSWLIALKHSQKTESISVPLTFFFSPSEKEVHE